MTRKCLKLYAVALIVAVAADAAVAAGIGPLQFSFANETLTALFLLPLQLAGCV